MLDPTEAAVWRRGPLSLCSTLCLQGFYAGSPEPMDNLGVTHVSNKCPSQLLCGWGSSGDYSSSGICNQPETMNPLTRTFYTQRVCRSLTDLCRMWTLVTRKPASNQKQFHFFMKYHFRWAVFLSCLLALHCWTSKTTGNICMAWHQVKQVEMEQAVPESQRAHTSLQGGPVVLTLSRQLLQQLRRAPIRGSPHPGTRQKLRPHWNC